MVLFLDVLGLSDALSDLAGLEREQRDEGVEHEVHRALAPCHGVGKPNDVAEAMVGDVEQNLAVVVACADIFHGQAQRADEGSPQLVEGVELLDGFVLF